MHSRKHEILLFIAIIIAIFSYNQYSNTQQQYAASLSEGLILASNIKSDVSNYYMMNGHFPNNKTDIHLADFKPSPKTAISAIDILEGGIIQVSYNKRSGFSNHTLQLIPDDSNNAYGINWVCVTSSKKITSLIATCDYLP